MKINSHTEWDPLKEIIVGRGEGQAALQFSAGILPTRETLQKAEELAREAFPQWLLDEINEDLEELSDGGIAEIVVHDRALLAGDHDVLRPQDGERKAASSFFGGLTPSLPGNLSISRSAIG